MHPYVTHGGDQLLGHRVHQRGVEILGHALVQLVQSQFLGIHDPVVAAELFQKALCPLVQGTGAAHALEQEDGQVLVAGLEGAVEILAGVDGHAVDGLHLLEEAEGVSVGGFPGGAAAHHVPDCVILIGHGELDRLVLHDLIGLAVDLRQLLEGIQGLVIVGVAAVLLQQPEGDLQGGTLAVAVDQGGVLIPLVGVVVGDVELGALGGEGVGVAGQADGHRAFGVGDLDGLHRLGGGLGGGTDHQSIAVDGLGRGVDELTAVIGLHPDRPLLVQEEAGGVGGDQ